jgi:hypothetical protein
MTSMSYILGYINKGKASSLSACLASSRDGSIIVVIRSLDAETLGCERTPERTTIHPIISIRVRLDDSIAAGQERRITWLEGHWK